jgi:cephalosporin hydroxylase
VYPLWDLVVAPVVRAARPRRVLEIGALRGDTTVRLLQDLGPDSEVHVIDPLPEFDPAEHERAFPGRYVFYRDISHNVLPSMPAMDVALVDGDHNWFTVYRELQMLEQVSRAEGARLPVLILHDVAWPYGRRDLYYVPDRIPEEYRQPYELRGMRLGNPKLAPVGGFNVNHYNAVEEGGPRNGVMTALDDFLAEYGRPYRQVVIPIYFGLAIVVDEARLAESPELAAMLDRLESSAMKDQLLALSEQIRLDGGVFLHDIMRVKDAAIATEVDRYLDILKGAVLDEHYLESEVRIEYLLDAVEAKRPIGLDKVRDPAHNLPAQTRRLRAAREAGLKRDEYGNATWFPFTDMGRRQLDRLHEALDTIGVDEVPGDVVECATGRGGAAIFMKGHLTANGARQRRVWVADRFKSGSQAPGLNEVREGFHRFGLLDDGVRFLQGEYAATLPDADIDDIAVLRIGAASDSDVETALELLHDRVSPGGFVFIDDYTDDACKKIVDDFRSRHAVTDPLELVGPAAATWRRATTDTVLAASRDYHVSARDHSPRARAAAAGTIDLTVVVVVYNMRREAERTLHSLSRAYQLGIDDLDYEVLVVENGSNAEQHLDADFVRRFGPEFRYIDMADDAVPSPTVALNRGLTEGRGRAFAFMIDGAHVLTPGVLRWGVTALQTYAPAVVATQQWFVGPGQQPEVVRDGYDQTVEDELFDQIRWPEDGYRLFDIGHFQGDRDWFDGMYESNCIFVPRSLLQQFGGWDDDFSMPGGGFANLEFFERMAAAPGVTKASILGEGSFHQVHHGTTTNQGDAQSRRDETYGYGQHFESLRGRPFRGPPEAMHFVGSLAGNARRTRARQMSADAFVTKPVATGPDGVPSEPLLVPDDLRNLFIEAFWKSLAWRDSTWLGAPTPNAPTDLYVYQELVTRVRPDLVVVVGTGGDGRALFFASVCEGLGRGRVLAIDAQSADNRPTHPRLQYVTADPDSRAAVEALRAKPKEQALVLLGGYQSRPTTSALFKRYQSLVKPGSYVVVEGTAVHGHPIWPGFGPGPHEGAEEALAANGDFVRDVSVEKYSLTLNPGGYLKRIR